MLEVTNGTRDAAVRRLFLAQAVIIALALALVLGGYFLETRSADGRSLGMFWFTFLAGCVGASVSLARRMKRSPETVADVARSHFVALMPLLYGGLMAGVAYFLFLSGVLSGDGGGGLFTTNLFPNFGDGLRAVDGVHAADKPPVAPPPTLKAFIDLRPTTMADAGKLLVWGFVAGHSEKFVTSVLTQLESRTGGADD